MTQQAIVEVAIEHIVANPQVRQQFDQDAEAGLAQSIKEVGILQPLRVREHDGKPIIVDGERRYRAAKRLGLATVPVIFEQSPLGPAEVIHRQLVANCQREDLRPLEKGRAIARLMKATGWSHSAAAAKLGMTNAGVTRALALLALPQAIKEQVNAGLIPASAAYELARIKDPHQQADFATRLAANEMTRDGLAGTIKAQRIAKATTSKPRAMRATAQLAPGRTVTVTGEGLNIEKFIASLEELLAKARKARTQGVELQTLCRMLRDRAET